MYDCDLWCVQTESRCNALETPMQKYPRPQFKKEMHLKYSGNNKVLISHTVDTKWLKHIYFISWMHTADVFIMMYSKTVWLVDLEQMTVFTDVWGWSVNGILCALQWK